MKEPTDMGFETLPIDTYSIDISIVLKIPDLSNAKSVAQDLYLCRGPLPSRTGINVETKSVRSCDTTGTRAPVRFIFHPYEPLAMHMGMKGESESVFVWRDLGHDSLH